MEDKIGRPSFQLTLCRMFHLLTRVLVDFSFVKEERSNDLVGLRRNTVSLLAKEPQHSSAIAIHSPCLSFCGSHFFSRVETSAVGNLLYGLGSSYSKINKQILWEGKCLRIDRGRFPVSSRTTDVFREFLFTLSFEMVLASSKQAVSWITDVDCKSHFLGLVIAKANRA